MRAVLCKRLDGPEALVIEDVPTAEPGPGEIAVTVRVAALNFFDTLITRGKYQTSRSCRFRRRARSRGLWRAWARASAGFGRGTGWRRISAGAGRATR